MTITELDLRSLGMTHDGRKNTKKVIKHKADKEAGRAKYCQAAECKDKDIPLGAYSTNKYCEPCMTHGRHLEQEVKAKRADRGAPSGEEEPSSSPGWAATDYKPLKNLKLLCTERQAKLTEVSAATAIPLESLWQYSSAKIGRNRQLRGCPPDKAQAIAKFLGVSVAVLTGEEPYLSGEEKSCNQCAEAKDLVHFYRDSKGSSGRKRICKTCSAKYQKVHKKKKREGAS